jgi:cytochrome c553
MQHKGWSGVLIVPLLAGCLHRGSPPPEPAPGRELLVHSVAIHDALVQGDLHEARARAGQMAALPGADVSLRLMLAEISGAGTLADTTAGMGHLAQYCADCHAAQGVSLDEQPVSLLQAVITPASAPLERSLDQLEVHLSGASTQELRSAPLSERGTPYAELLTTCADCHLAGRSPPHPRLQGVPLPELKASMGQHFDQAVDLGLHVMEGDLERARLSATALASTSLSQELPETAWPYVAELQEAARQAEQATGLVEMALATAQIELACARCHTATGAGPTQTLTAPSGERHMSFHLYGVYWMGYGLLAPDERAWMLGATVLASAWMLPPGWSAPPEQRELEEAVHGLAQYALATQDPQARAEIRAALLVSCPACHASGMEPL